MVAVCLPAVAVHALLHDDELAVVGGDEALEAQVEPILHRGAVRAVSQQVHAIFSEYTDLIQPLSPDEAPLDVTANLRCLPTA